MGGESVSVHVDNVDIAGSLCNTFVNNFQTFVDERKNQAIDDFICVDLTTLDAEFGRLALDNLENFGITGLCARVGIIAVKTCTTFLPDPAHLNKYIRYAICAWITTLVGG